jgi:hypothetical protein
MYYCNVGDTYEGCCFRKSPLSDSTVYNFYSRDCEDNIEYIGTNVPTKVRGNHYLLKEVDGSCECVLADSWDLNIDLEHYLVLQGFSGFLLGFAIFFVVLFSFNRFRGS